MWDKLRHDIIELRKSFASKVVQNIKINENYSFMVLDGRDKPYIPSNTNVIFHQDDSFVRCLTGCYGSGKSSCACAEITLRTCAMPPCIDGIRRARWAIVRNTYADLLDTSLQTWLAWFDQLGGSTHRMTPRIFYHYTFNDGKGVIELELMFLALDRPDHIRKLKSLELTGVYLNELSELPQASITHFKARVNRYPSQRDCPHEYWSGLIADTNPPAVDHWLYKLFEADRPKGHRIIHYPPPFLIEDDKYIVNPEADYLQYHKGGIKYYQQMMLGQSQEFINVYVLGHYGTVIEGKFVYQGYNDDLHAVDGIDINSEYPILLAWDYGIVSPACLLIQCIDGQIRCIKEFICEYMTVKELYDFSVLPFLSEKAKGLTIEGVGDPADTYHGREELYECELTVQSASTNKIQPRISAVSDLLNQLIRGHPRLIISKEGCPKLRQGFLGKYNYRRLRVIGEERYQDVPNKIHPYSDIHDALQYGALFYKIELDVEEDVVDPDDLKYDETTANPITGY